MLAHCALGHQLSPGLHTGHVPARENERHEAGAVGQRAAQDLRPPPGLHFHRGDVPGDPGPLAPLDVAYGNGSFYRDEALFALVLPGPSFLAPLETGTVGTALVGTALVPGRGEVGALGDRTVPPGSSGVCPTGTAPRWRWRAVGARPRRPGGRRCGREEGAPIPRSRGGGATARRLPSRRPPESS